MPSYIEREALKDIIRREGLCGAMYTDTEREEDLYRMIDAAPTADVAPVVRCKDCKSMSRDLTEYGIACRLTMREVNPNDFCSYGARMEGGRQNAK